MDYFFHMSEEEKLNFIKYSIDCGYYVILQVYKNKIPAYHDTAFIDHQIMVYGYDDEIKRFCISDFFRGKYRKDVCFYGEFLEAWNLSLENFDKIDMIHIYLLKPKKIVPFDGREESSTGFYSFDASVISIFLEDYINNNNTMFRYRIRETEDISNLVYRWGLDCYDLLIEYLRNRNSKDFIDPRPFYTITEHKRLMKKRCEMLIEEFGICDFTKNYIELERNCNILLLKMMKHNQYLRNNKYSEVNDYTNYINQLKELDRNISQRLLDSIKNNMKECH